jgi:hypothetical protein
MSVSCVVWDLLRCMAHAAAVDSLLEVMPAQLVSPLTKPSTTAPYTSPGASHTRTWHHRPQLLKRQAFRDHKVDVLGVVLDKVPREDQAILTSQLRRKFQEAGLVFAGGIPEDHVLESVRWVWGWGCRVWCATALLATHQHSQGALCKLGWAACQARM